jgi:hypothetical protein
MRLTLGRNLYFALSGSVDMWRVGEVLTMSSPGEDPRMHLFWDLWVH